MKARQNRRTGRWRRLCFAALAPLGFLTGAYAASPEASATEPDDFTNLSLDQLGQIKVTSVSKKAERVFAAPAAVSVLTSDDLRRSGAQTLPEALRLVPGVEVARVDSAQWAVSIRGFNDTFSQKLLVLMDGRSIYSPLFSGVMWQMHGALMDDLDRIEVIRGPGGTVWGANAVNGVINIVSKSAADTQGLLVTGGGGSAHEAMAGVRYGFRVGENAYMRVYGHYDGWSESDAIGAGDANDAWWRSNGGVRWDWVPSAEDRFTLQADLMTARMDTVMPNVTLPVFGSPEPPTGYSYTAPNNWNQDGLSLLGRWTRTFSEDSDITLQTFYEHHVMDTAVLDESAHVFDLDVRHRWRSQEWNELVWGGGYRIAASGYEDSTVVEMANASRADSLVNVFVQDEISLIPDRLRWTIGTKIEHNDFTGLEFEPGTRLAWTPTERQTIWASIARAVRTPSQVEHDARINIGVLPANPPTSPLPTVVSAVGNDNFESETVIAYELGYRVQAHKRLTLDFAGFVNDYDRLRTSAERLDLSAAPNYTRVESVIVNQGSGQTYGGELSAQWHMLDWWRLGGQVSVLQTDIDRPPNALTGEPTKFDVSSPSYQASFRSSVDLGRQAEFDLWVRYVDSIDAAGVSIPGLSTVGAGISSYVTLDARLAWRPTKGLELSVIGQNLAGSHREFNPTFISSEFTKASPSVFAKLTWHF